MLDKVLIVDVEIPQFRQNRVLDLAYASQFPGAPVFAHLSREATAAGWRVMTSDVFLEDRPRFRRAATVSNEFTMYLPDLIDAGVEPLLLVSGESPNVAHSFYRDLPVRGGRFAIASLFRGALDRLPPGVQAEPFLWPSPAMGVFANDVRFDARKLLGWVTSLKGAFRGPRQWLKEIPERMSGWWDRSFRRSMQYQDLYGFRVRVARTFAGHEGFYLQGKGWGSAVVGSNRWYRSSIDFAHPPSPCVDKIEVLREFRFGLAVENAGYPGYVTEKIFDVLRAGSVPVYAGAPDIADFVPRDCFIDIHQHGTLQELWSHLTSMSESRWLEYHSAGREFLQSSRYAEHIDVNVARRWVQWIDAITPECSEARNEKP